MGVEKVEERRWVDSQGKELGGTMSVTLRFWYLLGMGGRGIGKRTILSPRSTEIERSVEGTDFG